jgi:hypothetical protein
MSEKRFGIRIAMLPTHTLRAPHLLGENWESFRWYDTEEERDSALEELQRPITYYRKGDAPPLVWAKVQR